ncbi:hypothetical protein ALQ08_200221 [Pseudomonas syringae pv. delphinii]|uniref:Uncharacterized protein n=1 Tax=Pseudomonas syringae pv. delphinii TaxID=192088 RepID=A0A0P9PYF5_9PSED|nr:hypothetical protein ALO72_200224 [Pseudomonas syringae pv. delphinii]RMQ28587.1 hypothetical protein ALQ08_200221 [Pseudomonas syringae pv. delphinii]
MSCVSPGLRKQTRGLGGLVAHETHLYDMAHEIISEELDDFSDWLKKELRLTK